MNIEEIKKAIEQLKDSKIQCEKCGTYKEPYKFNPITHICLDCETYLRMWGKYPVRLK